MAKRGPARYLNPHVRHRTPARRLRIHMGRMARFRHPVRRRLRVGCPQRGRRPECRAGFRRGRAFPGADPRRRPGRARGRGAPGQPAARTGDPARRRLPDLLAQPRRGRRGSDPRDRGLGQCRLGRGPLPGPGQVRRGRNGGVRLPQLRHRPACRDAARCGPALGCRPHARLCGLRAPVPARQGACGAGVLGDVSL